MKPIEMILSAWGPFKEKEKIDFRSFEGKGLFLITGPTGSGKTTIFDGITFALYGETSGDMRDRESLRSDFSKEGIETYVNLLFSHNEKTYTIYRSPKYLRPKKRKTGKDELVEEKERARLIMPDHQVIEGNREVNAKIQEILALDYRQFKQTTMLAQGEFTRLLYASPFDKTKIFREIFGTTIYKNFENMLKEKSKALYKNYKSIQDKMDENIANVPLSGEEWLELVERDSISYEKVKDYLVTERKNVQAFIKEEDARCKKLDKELEKISERLEKARAANEKLSERDKVEENLAALENVLEEMKGEEEVIKAARRAAYVEASYRQWNERKKVRSRLEEKIEGLKEEQRILKEKEKELFIIKEKEEFYQEMFEKAHLLAKMNGEAAEKEKAVQRKEKELFSMQEKYKEKELILQGKKELYERKDRERKRAAIGIAASCLEEGKPCPVCGSLDHPRIARMKEGVLSEEALEALKKDYEKENALLLGIYGETATKKEQLETVAAEKKALAAKIKKDEEIVYQLIQDNEAAVLFLKKQWAMDELCLLEEPYNRKRKELEQLEKKLLSTESLLEDSRKEKIQEITREKESRLLFEKALKEQDFQSEEEFLGKLMEPKLLESRSEKLEQYQKELHRLKKRKQELLKECEELKKSDIDSIIEEGNQKKTARSLVLKEREKQAVLENALRTAEEGLKEKLKKWEAVRKEYGIVKGLEDVTIGNNKKRLVFEQYVLAEYFDEILEAANLRFGKMTGNRFQLERIMGVTDGRTKDNLEIAVFDYYTGKSRSVKTLSGGEAFKASLSLSLGLSDVIQRSNGGIRVETLFVDEGFGSLDSQSLDQAVLALYSLVENDRMIGIISHVPELKERIRDKILVERSPKGSRVFVES